MHRGLDPAVAALINTELIPLKWELSKTKTWLTSLKNCKRNQDAQQDAFHSVSFSNFALPVNVRTSAKQHPTQKPALNMGGYIPDYNQLDWSYNRDNQ